jgi:hypothetical protein
MPTATKRRPSKRRVKEEDELVGSPPVVTEPAELDVDQRLADITPECREDLLQLMEDFREHDASNLESIWKIGRDFEAYKGRHTNRPILGGHCVDVVQLAADVVKRSLQSLNQTGQFWRLFPTLEDKDKLLSMRTRSGLSLSWNCIRNLMPLSSVGGNNTCFEEGLRLCVANDWTPADIGHYIDAQRAAARIRDKYKGHAGGRKPATGTVSSRCDRLIHQTREMLRSALLLYDHPELNVLDSLRALPQEQVGLKSAEFIDLLCTMRDNMTQLDEFFQKHIREVIPAALEYVAGCVEHCPLDAVKPRKRRKTA